MKVASDHRINIDEGTVHVNATGIVTVHAANALLSRASEFVEPGSPQAFLFDCRYSILSMSMADLERVAASFATRFSRARIALVLSPTHSTRREAANRAVQAGFDVRVFTNLLDANHWLKQRRHVTTLRQSGRRKAVSANEIRYTPRTVVDLDIELAYWCARFGCTASEMRLAIQAVGLDIKSVEAYINEQRAQGNQFQR